MNVTLVFAPADGQEAAARLTGLLSTLGVTVEAAAADAAVIALLTPAALHDAAVLQRLGGVGKPPLALAVPAPAVFPAPADLARIIEWLHAPAPAAARPKYDIRIEHAVNTTIGDGGVTVNVFGGGWSAAETAGLVSALRGQSVGAPMSAQELRGLLAQMQAQVQQVDMTLRVGFTAVLTRFDLSEQRIVGPILARLDAQHAAQVAALLDALDAAVLPQAELVELLAPVSAALLAARSRAALPLEVNQTADLIEAPGLDVKHKLKLTIPLIPFLLDYEGELEFDIKANLETAWQALKHRLTRR